MEAGIMEQQELEELDAEIRQEMSEVVKFADDSPFPPPEAALTNVWPQ